MSRKLKYKYLINAVYKMSTDKEYQYSALFDSIENIESELRRKLSKERDVPEYQVYCYVKYIVSIQAIPYYEQTNI